MAGENGVLTSNGLPPSGHEEGLLHDRAFQTALRASAGVVAVVAALFLVYTGWSIIQPLLVSTVLAAMLWPWITRIASLSMGPRKWRIPRVAAAALVYLATFATAGLVIWIGLTALLPRLDHLLEQYPQQSAFLEEYLDPIPPGGPRRRGGQGGGRGRQGRAERGLATAGRTRPQGSSQSTRTRWRWGCSSAIASAVGCWLPWSTESSTR